MGENGNLAYYREHLAMSEGVRHGIGVLRSGDRNAVAPHQIEGQAGGKWWFK